MVTETLRLRNITKEVERKLSEINKAISMSELERLVLASKLWKVSIETRL